MEWLRVARSNGVMARAELEKRQKVIDDNWERAFRDLDSDRCLDLEVKVGFKSHNKPPPDKSNSPEKVK
jgi:hypothetical protein